MFTTIEKLRKSTALQDRVTKVENYLKRNYSNYQPTDKFPIFLIMDSNGYDDYSWVMEHKNVHVTWPEMSKPLMEGLTLEGRAANASSYMNWLEAEAAKHNNKGRTITNFKERYNGIKAQLDAAKPAAKTPAAKTAAVKTPAAKTAAVKTPAAKTAAVKTPVAKKAVAKKAAAKTAAKTPVAKKAAAKTPVAKKAVAKKAVAKKAASTVLPATNPWPFPTENSMANKNVPVEIPVALSNDVGIGDIQSPQELIKNNLIAGAHHIALGNLMITFNQSSAEIAKELTGKYQEQYVSYMKASGLALDVIQAYLKAFMDRFGRLITMSSSLKESERNQLSWPFNLTQPDDQLEDEGKPN